MQGQGLEKYAEVADETSEQAQALLPQIGFRRE